MRQRGRPAKAANQPDSVPEGPSGLIINGWTFLAWPAFDERWSQLILKVARRRTSDPGGYQSSPEARLLKGLVQVIRHRIARDPNDPDHRLRRDLAAWRRVKLFGRYRLFYRFSSDHRVVVLVWLNDEQTLRKAGAKTDPYVVFSSMLARGEIPASWTALIAESSGVDPLPEAGL